MAVSKSANTPTIAGFWHHTAAVGDLLTSLYRLGSPLPDASPGLGNPAKHADQLNVQALNRVVALEDSRAFVEAYCPVSELIMVCRTLGWQLAWPKHQAAQLSQRLVGQAICQGDQMAQITSSIRVLTASGLVVDAEPTGQQTELFHATLGGHGATGLLVAAWVNLQPLTE
jgi:hypothetical protein